MRNNIIIKIITINNQIKIIQIINRIIQMMIKMILIVKMHGIKMVLKKEKENLLYRLEC